MREQRSGLDARFALLWDQAPINSLALWSLAADPRPHLALHAMWTGPEISCPIARDALPAQIDLDDLPVENGSRQPGAGEIVLVRFEAGAVGPTRPFPAGGLDVGIFYGEGGRLYFPSGWIEGSVCARVVEEDALALAAAASAIRRSGLCELQLEQIP